MKPISVLYFVVLMLLLSDTTEAKKVSQKKKLHKKKKNSEIVHPEQSSYKRPAEITPGLYCEACKGAVRTVVKRLYGKTKEVDVIEALEKVCDADLYLEDPHPPMEMNFGCEAIL